MEVFKIKYCANCKRDIEPTVEVKDTCVTQRCPHCNEIVGQAGVFAHGGLVSALRGYKTNRRIAVKVVDKNEG